MEKKHVFYELFLFTIFCVILHQANSMERVYFIGAVETLWDYGPSERNNIKGISFDADSDASVFTKKSSNRIGKIYKKAIYRPFTDLTFTKRAPHSESYGILGPTIKGEVGDDIIIYFKNMASRNYTMHPHGVFYNKASEGALYKDNTAGFMKGDDHVPPGKMRKYIWQVTKEFAPESGDPNCLTWLYHSHLDPVKDTNTGLIGTLLTCKKEFLDQFGKRKDVDKEFFLLFKVFDENKSWYLDDNLRANNIDPSKINKEDEGFQESNLMHGISGRIYGNLKGLEMCFGDRISWHLSGLGNEVDIHTAYFQGNTMVADHRRTDVEILFPARSATALMHTINPGKWMLSCQVADHYSAGMSGIYSVKSCKKPVVDNIAPNGKLRTYYIAAEEIEWDYGPSGQNLYGGGKLDASGSNSAAFFSRGPDRIGGKYIKALFKEYTDQSFKTKKARKSPEDYLGLLGPIIRAEVGDVITVHFKNKAQVPFSLQPHGVLYNKANEGGLYNDGSKDTADNSVKPGFSYTYMWTVPMNSGPAEHDPPCITYFYSSAVDRIKDMYSGLIGPLVICKQKVLDSDNLPENYKNEKFLLMSIIDENKSWYLDKNMKKYCTKDKCNGINKENEAFVESNKMHSINGYKYGNLPNLNLCKGEQILWHVIGMGTEADIHTIYFQGNGFDDSGNHKDTTAVFPGSFATFTMIPDNVGKWGLVCRTNNHLLEGMTHFYTVSKCTNNKKVIGEKVRNYYIGIVEREWNYAPSNQSITQGFLLDEMGRDSRVFVHRGPKSIGKIYKKALYREFTNSSFTEEKKRSEREAHLGFLGPIIMAEEGDKIQVMVKNMAGREYSITPHGVFYGKGDKGSPFPLDNTSKSSGVQPGKNKLFTWIVPKRSAPGPTDSACITWAYYSSIDPVKDTNSGLIGPLIICRKGTLNKEGKRKDIDRDFVLTFTILDENDSWYLDDNIKKYIGPTAKIDKSDDNFKESNKMHAINGFIYGNARHFTMMENEKVNWYVIGMGGELDMHTVHFHGHTFVHRTNSRHREDVYDLFPGIFATLEMKATHPGQWLLHCHVADHMTAGMTAIYTITAHGNHGSNQLNKDKHKKDSGGSSVSCQILIFVTFVAMLFSY